MHSVKFMGEESARFARFAVELIEIFGPNTIDVSLKGREPITSKYIYVRGKVSDALNQGYRRHVVIKEIDTQNIYWAAGTNSTSSIATITIEFLLTKEQLNQMIIYGKSNNIFVPTLADKIGLDTSWCFVDSAAQSNNITIENAEKLINILRNCNDQMLLRETALALRSYVDLLSHRMRLRSECELCACRKIDSISSDKNQIDARIAMIELIGYIGTTRSIKTLESCIFSSDHPHIRWAAIIALGRLPSDEVLDIFLRATELFKVQTHDRSINERAGVPDDEWVEAALLLCISRRIMGISDIDIQKRLEEYFTMYFESNNIVLHHYACLGLSQLDNLSSITIDLLIELLDSTNEISDKGYYAMALLPTFRTNNNISSKIWTQSRIDSVRDVLNRSLLTHDINQEPDSIWGLENLADLSLEIENNNLAYKYHSNLSQLFFDWRFSYYEALASYEKAEISIENHRPFTFVKSQFNSALECIQFVQDEDEYAMSIINFRTAIMKARINLLEILNDWQNASTKESLSRLKLRIRTDVINIFRLYIIGDDNQSFQQGVSKRELDCINDTSEIVSIVEKIINFHEILYKFDLEEASNLISEILVDIDRAIGNGSFSFGHLNLLRHLFESLSRIRDELGARGNIGYENTLRLIQETIAFINSVSWTMPAQMCLLTGLGKGTISIVNDNITGIGTADDPYIFKHDSTSFDTIVSVSLEVNTGSTIQTSIICESLNQKHILSGIVEGSAICSFSIPPQLLATDVSLPIAYCLEFASNDIKQKCTPTVFYFRRL